MNTVELKNAMDHKAAAQNKIPMAICQQIISVIISYYLTTTNFYEESALKCFDEFLSTTNLNLSKYI